MMKKILTLWFHQFLCNAKVKNKSHIQTHNKKNVLGSYGPKRAILQAKQATCHLDI